MEEGRVVQWINQYWESYSCPCHVTGTWTEETTRMRVNAMQIINKCSRGWRLSSGSEQNFLMMMMMMMVLLCIAESVCEWKSKVHFQLRWRLLDESNCYLQLAKSQSIYDLKLTSKYLPTVEWKRWKNLYRLLMSWLKMQDIFDLQLSLENEMGNVDFWKYKNFEMF